MLLLKSNGKNNLLNPKKTASNLKRFFFDLAKLHLPLQPQYKNTF